MTLWEKYFDYHPEILLRIEAIDKKTKEKFIRKLKLETDKDNFLSTITEFQFYEFLIKEGFVVEFEKEYTFDNKALKFTPDFTVSKQGQSIIAEVLKLNTTEKDKKRNDFESFLLDGIQKNTAKCCVQVELIEEYFDVELYDKDSILAEVSSWLKSSYELNEELVVRDNFKFKIISIDEKYEHTLVFGNVNSIDIDTRRLNSINSRFVSKIEKYDRLIAEMDMPYLICLKIDFHAAINEKEMFWTMYGDLIFHEYIPKYVSELNGLYYRNETAKRNLSGVVLMISNQIYYFNNYFLSNRLKQEIRDEFLKYQFLGETFNKLVYLKEVPK